MRSMSYKYFITLLMSSSPILAVAQTEFDALRFSQTNPASTALSLGMGGVGGSMGGDFNSLSINPSGIGVYRSNEVTITPTLKINGVSTQFDNQNTISRNSSTLFLDNIGLVLANNRPNSNWRTVSFAIGMNTLNNYQYKDFTKGSNNSSSISDIMSASALQNGVGANTVPPYGFLGYQGYIIDEDYAPVLPLGSIQSKLNEHKGNAKEINLTVGGNYQDRILLGGSLGITTYGYERFTKFTEDDATLDINNDFKYVDLTETVRTDGVGVNLKGGATFIPNKNTRIGVALHSPTWISMTDQMDYKLESNTENYKSRMGYDDRNPVSVAQPDNIYEYEYSLRTPWKGILSATFLGKNGMISADYELNNFKSMKYGFDAVDYNYESYINEQIKNTYTASHTFRLGGELVMDRMFLRAGAAYQTSPYQDNKLHGGERYDLSIGTGFRFDQFFLDIGYMYRNVTGGENLYNVSAGNIYNPYLSTTRNHNYVALTLGYKPR